jgi:iron(III) transport system substrate-binding protein
MAAANTLFETTLQRQIPPESLSRVSSYDWFGSLVHAMGEEKGMAFFRKLANMKPQMRTGHTLMAELIASGEIPLALDIYNHNAERLKRVGSSSIF